MWVTKWLGIAMVCIALAACGGLASKSAELYEFEDRQWVIISESSIEPGNFAGSLNTRRIIAMRQKDGTFLIVGSTGVYDQGEGNTLVERKMDAQVQRAYVGPSEDPVGDLIKDIGREGKLISDLDHSKIAIGRKTISFSDDAFKKPKVEREREGGMY